MTKSIIPILLAVMSLGWAGTAWAQSPLPADSKSLDALAERTVHEVCDQFAAQKLKPDDLSVTIIDMRDRAHLASGSFRGEARTYPASVVKLFYLNALERWLEDGKLQDSAELDRATHDMIVDSNNDATTFVLEALTDAPNGPLLPADQMKAWEEKRNAVNRYYKSIGYDDINVCQKTYCEGPYGRDAIFLRHGANSNRLTTNATARLLCDIVLGKAVTSERSKKMMELLHRDMNTKSDGPDDQRHGFTAMILPKDAQLWSKSGWTGTNRHDAAYVEMPDGTKAILTIFTTGHGYQRNILPAISDKLLKGLHDIK